MSVSDQVNLALKRALSLDEGDLRNFAERKLDPVSDYDDFLRDMKRDGRL